MQSVQSSPRPTLCLILKKSLTNDVSKLKCKKTQVAKIAHVRSVKCRAENIRSEEDSSLLSTRRTSLLLGGLALTPFCQGAFAEEAEVAAEAVEQMAPVVAAPETEYFALKDPLLAYQFKYPKTDKAGHQLTWFVSRKPERYSSAAPLSADGRQRIVFEALDFTDPLTISVSVGPLPQPLQSTPRDKWSPEQVANSILEEKATGRVTGGQKVALSSLEDVVAEERNGTKYWLFEHVSQGSPNNDEIFQKETYRHSFASTALRGDYLYTLNITAPERRWEEVGDYFKQVQESFTLATPTKEFVSPDEAPWRFW
eukprot:CAMPEP_0196579430 /NCGR_PEP_ID=MMETSP1081-20130531/21992_1 /TAXON_ID=36882 /ORGANISM="Pyramimonas amylifera, Strain CCMP720" /LENGTH=311 /DNA_ID=CAMNT_0041899023 /DNA_START=69 /DNA_END=1004 /DNA_ORIENTATION=+